MIIPMPHNIILKNKSGGLLSNPPTTKIGKGTKKNMEINAKKEIN